MEDSASYCSSDSAGNGDYIVVNQSDSTLMLPSPTEPKMLRTAEGDCASATSTIQEQVESKMNDILEEAEAHNANEQQPQRTSSELETQATSESGTKAKLVPGSAVFDRITYIGSTTVSSTRNMEEISRKLAAFSKHGSSDPEVNFVIPPNREAPIQLVDGKSEAELKSFRLNRIGFCVAGRPNSDERCK